MTPAALTLGLLGTIVAGRADSQSRIVRMKAAVRLPVAGRAHSVRHTPAQRPGGSRATMRWK